MPKKRAITIYLLVFFSLYFSHVFANATYDELIKKYASNSHVGVIVANAKTGKIFYAKNSRHLFVPASNVKLFTAAAALYSLGPAYRFRTDVGIDPKDLRRGVLKGNLYIRFSGDPGLKSQDVSKLIADIKKYGINTIKGNIVIDASRFDDEVYGSEWALDDINWYFGAPVTPIIVDENTASLALVPAANGASSVSVVVAPEQSNYIRVENHIKTLTREKTTTDCVLKAIADRDNNIDLSGCAFIAPDVSEKDVGVALRDPLLYAENVISHVLSQEKIRFSGKVVTGDLPLGLIVIATIDSAPLYQLIATMLKKSDNLYAESVAKTLGRHRYGVGAFLSGTKAIMDILQPVTGIDFTKIKLTDGSGLSHNNLLSPHNVFRLLYVMYHDKKLGKYFIDGLARPGKEGTLEKRMVDHNMSKFLVAKTGSMGTHSSLSGYITAKSGKVLIFSIFINNIKDSKSAKQLEDELCLAFRRSY